MNQSSRKEAFHRHVADSKFVCSVGTAQARKNELQIVELPVAVDQQFRSVLHAVRQLLSAGRGSAIALLYPEEPTSYADLSRMHKQVHANVMAACLVDDAASAERQGNIKLPRAGQPIPHALFPFLAVDSRRKLGQGFVAYDAVRLINDFYLSIAEDPQDSVEDIRCAAQALLGIDGNVAPCVDGEALQAIVMSPVYSGDLSDRVRALLPKLGMHAVTHGRYAPATAMVVNHSRAVLDAAKSQQGAAIRQRMLSGASAYRYDPMHVLAEEPNEQRWYQRLQQAASSMDGAR